MDSHKQGPPFLATGRHRTTLAASATSLQNPGKASPPSEPNLRQGGCQIPERRESS